MIEKIPPERLVKDSDVVRSYETFLKLEATQLKINELVDAVNALERSTVGFDAAEFELARKLAEALKKPFGEGSNGSAFH